MKIGEVKVGTEYGATNGRRRTYSGDLPRRVTVLGIESVEVDYWQGGGFSSRRAQKTVRQLRVRCEDEPLKSKSSWEGDSPATAPKGTELLLEARLLVAPWSELRADVTARIAAQQDTADAKAEYLRRIKALLPKKLRDEWINVSADKGHNVRSKQAKHAAPGVFVSARLDGRVLDHLIDLAEKGAASEQRSADILAEGPIPPERHTT